jgi:Ca2+-binding RTX toxin-like protein
MLASVALAMVVLGGVAWAATIDCPNRDKYPSCVGTDRADRMLGTPTGDSMRGKKGGDTMYGRGTSDSVNGSFGPDKRFGGAALDIMEGGPGVDRIYGNEGNDSLRAGLVRCIGRDCDKDDVSVGVNRTKEIVDCGPHTVDEVWFEQGVDIVKNCEIKHPF